MTVIQELAKFSLTNNDPAALSESLREFRKLLKGGYVEVVSVGPGDYFCFERFGDPAVLDLASPCATTNRSDGK